MTAGGCVAPDRAAVLREWRRRQIRRDLGCFACEALRLAGQQPAAHHRLLLRELAAVARGEVRRLMVFMPPGSAKSSFASVIFPAWFLGGGGGGGAAVSVLAASHTAALAESFGRRVLAVLRAVPALGVRVRPGAGGGAWQTDGGGQYRAAGVGAAIAGLRADLGVIDDPVRGRADAESAAARDRVWDWYRADFATRLRPGARQVLVMTRWHEDDLAGRLLRADAAAWRVLRLPAVAGEDDPLGRRPGEWLWADDDYGYAAALRETRDFLERAGARRDWDALFQGEPRPAEGAVFRTKMAAVLDAVPPGRRVRGWDLAATAAAEGGDPDWTAGVLLVREDSGRFVVADVVRLRGGPEQVEAAIRGSAERDGVETLISVPQDPGQAGKVQALHLGRLLAGYRVEATPETGSKATRAAPLAAQCNLGNLAVVRGGWNAAFLEELRGFPGARKDDQVDAASRAFHALAAAPTPARALRGSWLAR